MSAEHLSFRVCRYPSHTPNYAGLESFQTGHHFTHFMSQLWAVSSTSLIENQMNSQAASPLIFYQRSIKWPAFQLFQSSAFFHLNQPSSSYVDNWFVISSIYFHLFLITVWIRLISFNCFLCANSSWLMAGSPQPLQHGPTVPISMPWHAYHPIHPSINEDSKWTKKGFQKNFKISPTFPTFPIFGHSHGIPYITHLLAYPSSKEFAANPSKVLPRRPKHSGSVSSVCWEVYALLKNSVQYFIALISSNFNMIEHIMILDMILNMLSMPQ